MSPSASFLHPLRPIRGLVDAPGLGPSSCAEQRDGATGIRIAGLAHITGGGITENLPRVLPRGTAAVIGLGSWPVQPIFEHLQKLGDVPKEEMLRTFNMGLGMLLIVPANKFKKAQMLLERAGEKVYTVGRIVKGDRKVLYS